MESCPRPQVTGLAGAAYSLMPKFPGRLALQQRVLPHYRAPLFDLLAESCSQGLSLFAGQPRSVEAIKTAESLQVAQLVRAQNIHLLRGSFYFCYQENIIDWLKKCDPDALILEANPRYLATPSAIKWMRSRGRPVIGWGFSNTFFEYADGHVGNQNILLHCGIIGALLLLSFFLIFNINIYKMGMQVKNIKHIGADQFLIFNIFFLGWFILHTTSAQQFSLQLHPSAAIIQSIFFCFGAVLYNDVKMGRF